MQVDNNNRAGIITATTLVGAGAGVAAGHYMPFVNAKSEATSDRFVKEVAKEMNANKFYNLVNAAGAKDYLDTVYPAGTTTYATGEQRKKFYDRFGDFLEIKEEQMLDEKGKALKGKALRDKLNEVVDKKIAENGEIKFTEDKKRIDLLFNTNEAEAKTLIKDGFKKKKLVSAGTTISKEERTALQRAMKTVRNERMIKGGIVAGLLSLATAAVVTCQKD